MYAYAINLNKPSNRRDGLRSKSSWYLLFGFFFFYSPIDNNNAIVYDVFGIPRRQRRRRSGDERPAFVFGKRPRRNRNQFLRHARTRSGLSGGGHECYPQTDDSQASGYPPISRQTRRRPRDRTFGTIARKIGRPRGVRVPSAGETEVKIGRHGSTSRVGRRTRI